MKLKVNKLVKLKLNVRITLNKRFYSFVRATQTQHIWLCNVLFGFQSFGGSTGKKNLQRDGVGNKLD